VDSPAAPIQFHGSQFRANRNGTRFFLPALSGARPGDTVIATIDVRGKPRIVPPRGWTLVRRDVVRSALTKAVYVHRVGSDEPAGYTWTFSKAQSAAGGVLAYGGVDSVAPVSAHDGSANPLSRSIAAPSVAAGHGVRLLGLFATATGTSIDTPAGMAERGESAATAGRYDVTSAVADAPWRGGATPSLRATGRRSGHNVGQVVVLRPAG
jgi:hypothetical protein